MYRQFFTAVLTAFTGLACAQTGSVSKPAYSDPYAPVGNPKYTVPAVVKPLMDYWMRDTYITYGPDGKYYLTGTTVTPDRKFKDGVVHSWDYNDGLYMWWSYDMKDWKPMGRIWSFDKDAAAYQKRGLPMKPNAKGPNGEPLDSVFRAVWAPELHYIKSKKQWLLVACMSKRNGSFILKSTSGKPEGPYVNIEGNKDAPLFKDIDGTLFEDDNGDVYMIGQDHYIAKLKSDLSGLAEPFRKFEETPYNPEPYIEGVYLSKHHGKYQLLQTVWSVRHPGDQFSFVEYEQKGKNFHSYDVVVAEADNVYGPYGPRYPAILEGGHNNLFTDKKGEWWSTTFFNPRGEMGKIFPQVCRPGVLAVKWENGKLMPDIPRTEAFYKGFKTKTVSR